MARRLFAVVVACALAPMVVAAQDYPKGWLPSSPDELAGIPEATLSRAYIPEAIDLSESFPAPGQQTYGSCVAWATGYAARSYYARLESGRAKFEDSLIPSPAHIHNGSFALLRAAGATKDACEKTGSSFFVATTFLAHNGALSLAEMPANKTCIDVNQTANMSSTRFRIGGRELISLRRSPPNTAARTTSAKSVNLDVVRQKISDGHPVLFAMYVGDRFTGLRPGEVYTGSVYATPDKNVGGHAMVVIGYDDRRRAFKIQNSWSTNWADGGRAWVSYETFQSDTGEIWTLKPDVDPPKPKPSRPEAVAAVTRTDFPELRCADVRSSTVASSQAGKMLPRWSGFVSTPEDAAYVRLLAAEVSKEGPEPQIDVRPWPVCEALLTLRDPIAAPDRPRVELVGGGDRIKVGQTFSFAVNAPAVPSYLYVLYIEDDGTVVNLAPRVGPLRAQTKERATLRFGDGKDGRPTFRVTPPKSVDDKGRLRSIGDPLRGNEAVIAIAARAPIDELEQLESADAKVYRVAAKATQAGDGPPDRLLLSVLRDIVLKRAEEGALPREVSADVLHLKIED